MDVQYIAKVNFLIFVHNIFLPNGLRVVRTPLLKVRKGGGVPTRFSQATAIVGSRMACPISILEKCEKIIKKFLHNFF